MTHRNGVKNIQISIARASLQYKKIPSPGGSSWVIHRRSPRNMLIGFLAGVGFKPLPPIFARLDMTFRGP